MYRYSRPAFAPNGEALYRGVMNRTSIHVAVVLRLCLLGAQAQAARADEPPAPRDTSLSIMRDVIEHFAADRGALERSYPLSLSDARQQRMARFYQEQSGKLNAIDFNALDRP